MLFSLLATAALVQVTLACESYAVDYKNGGSYFINSASNESFTATSQFYGCTGIANVILEGPNEESYYCSDLNTTVDNTDVTTTCPILKSDMYSGTWILVILDNNGNNASFNAERDLTLTVGVQATVLITPTVTFSATSTPIVNATSTITDVETTSLSPSTITSLASDAETQTKTIYPSRITITTTSSATVKRTTTSFTYSVQTVTATQVCPKIFAAMSPDPTASAGPLAIAQAAVSSASASASATAAAAAAARRVRVRDVKRRVARNAHLLKRTTDVATTTLTDTNTADWISTTAIVTGNATTVYAYTTVDTTTTVTPSPIVITATKTSTTVTAKTSTRTVTSRTTFTSLATKTKTTTFKFTTYLPCT